MKNTLKSDYTEITGDEHHRSASHKTPNQNEMRVLQSLNARHVQWCITQPWQLAINA